MTQPVSVRVTARANEGAAAAGRPADAAARTQSFSQVLKPHRTSPGRSSSAGS